MRSSPSRYRQSARYGYRGRNVLRLNMQIALLAVDAYHSFRDAHHAFTRPTGARRAHSSRATVSKTVSASKIQPQA